MEEKRKTLSLKKKEVIPPPVDLAKEAKAKARKIKEALTSRLSVHKKSTKLLLEAKHPMRIMQLTRMLDRLNRIMLETNKITVKYVDGKQVVDSVSF
jgi:hypothetical protein